MDNKKVGVVIFIVSALLLIVFILLIKTLNRESVQLGCMQSKECQEVKSSLSIVHFAFGVFGFLFSLGFYLLVFNQGEKAIVKRLEEDTTRKLGDEKFSILLKGLDEFEKNVLVMVRSENGITQQSLRLRGNMSKAKLSQVLSNLEKKNLVRREKKKKTMAVYITEEF